MAATVSLGAFYQLPAGLRTAFLFHPAAWRYPAMSAAWISAVWGEGRCVPRCAIPAPAGPYPRILPLGSGCRSGHRPHPPSGRYAQRPLHTVFRKTECSRIYEATDSAKSLVPNGWAMCEAVEATARDKPVTIEIGGIRVLAETDTAPELLVKVCRALKSLC